MLFRHVGMPEHDFQAEAPALPGKPYVSVVLGIVAESKPTSLLDAPAGGGWLLTGLSAGCAVDGIDLYEARSAHHYRRYYAYDLNNGLPAGLPPYDMVVCCEGIEHLANPGLLLEQFRTHLTSGGTLLITTPNTWYVGARLAYFLRGHFPGFPNLVGRIKPGAHMHIIPWSFPQLYLHLTLRGFINIRLHKVGEGKPISQLKKLLEYIFGWPLLIYCRSKLKHADSDEERAFWSMAGSHQSLYGRRLVVTAQIADRNPQDAS